jgi:hypothetical protein
MFLRNMMPPFSRLSEAAGSMFLLNASICQQNCMLLPSKRSTLNLYYDMIPNHDFHCTQPHFVPCFLISLCMKCIFHNTDMMLISETHFSEKSYLKPPNYRVYHRSHPARTAQGGTAIIIKNSINHLQLNNYS